MDYSVVEVASILQYLDTSFDLYLHLVGCESI